MNQDVFAHHHRLIIKPHFRTAKEQDLDERIRNLEAEIDDLWSNIETIGKDLSFLWAEGGTHEERLNELEAEPVEPKRQAPTSSPGNANFHGINCIF